MDDQASSVLRFLFTSPGANENITVLGLMVFLIITCLTAVVLLRRKTRLLHQQLERLQYDFLVANRSAIGMGQQILALEKQLYQPQQHSNDTKSVRHTRKPETVGNLSLVRDNASHDDSKNDVYEKSRQLLAQGHDIQQVIKASGLSYSEVSLMKALVGVNK